MFRITSVNRYFQQWSRGVCVACSYICLFLQTKNYIKTLLILAMFALRKPAVEVTAGETTRVGMHILRSAAIIANNLLANYHIHL